MVVEYTMIGVMYALVFFTLGYLVGSQKILNDITKEVLKQRIQRRKR
jgi:ABC-type sulfate transport system permease component